jgi:sec-independent protein translocase protein TatB
MFDIGWSELLLIGVVALIVVGPRDLPGMFRTLGRLTAKARSMGREFSRAMEDAARESGLNEAATDLKDLKGLASKKSLGLDALEKATEKFEKWEPKMGPAKAGSAVTGAAAAGTSVMAPAPEELEAEPEPPKPAKAAAKPKRAASGATPAKPAKSAKPAAAKPAEAPAKKPAARKTAAKKPAAKSDKA